MRLSKVPSALELLGFASGRPAELLAANDVQVQVVNALAAFLAVIYDESPSVGEPLLGGDFSCSNHEMP